jgi:hypothetical protein
MSRDVEPDDDACVRVQEDVSIVSGAEEFLRRVEPAPSMLEVAPREQSPGIRWFFDRSQDNWMTESFGANFAPSTCPSSRATVWSFEPGETAADGR